LQYEPAASTIHHMSTVRRAAVAGAFYPSNAARLSSDVDELLAKVRVEPEVKTPKAAIVPHAGYVYSGAVAAIVYAQLRSARTRVRRLVLLGPSHFARVRGIAWPPAVGMQTPLGVVPIDVEGLERVKRLPQLLESGEAHSREHSLEVQLPFLQRALDRFAVLPFAVGDAEPEAVATLIEALWGGSETVILVSSDLSHYLPYDLAVKADRQTADSILKLRPALVPNEDACGATPINGLLLAASKRGLRPALLDLCNSGDTAGPHSEVVGYGAFTFHEAESAP
jgi:AmmeMemoRadiSam system protein B